MSRIRGLSCSQCSNKIDRYDEAIDCQVCINSFHIKCSNIPIENYYKMREDGAINKWKCENCESTTDFHDSTSQLQVNSKDETNKFDSIVQLAVEKALAPLISEILNLKDLVVTQSKQINSLIDKIHHMQGIKNSSTTQTADRSFQRSPPVDKETEHMKGIPPDLSATINNSSTENEDSKTPAQVSSAVTDALVEPRGVSSEWTVVENRKKSNRKNQEITKSKTKQLTSTALKQGKYIKPITGSSSSTALQSAPRKRLSHIHITRLSPSTSVEDINKFLNNITTNFTCEQLKSKQPDIYSSFKITFPSEYETKLMDPELWPEGIMINKFFLRRRIVNHNIT